MIDIELYRLRVGSFSGSCHRKRKRFKNGLVVTSKKAGSPHNINAIFISILLVITLSQYWSPEDSRAGKNRQRNQTFKNMEYVNDTEKRLFNELRTLQGNYARAESHLLFFNRCLELNVYPVNLDISDHLQVAFEYKKAIMYD